MNKGDSFDSANPKSKIHREKQTEHLRYNRTQSPYRTIDFIACDYGNNIYKLVFILK